MLWCTKLDVECWKEQEDSFLFQGMTIIHSVQKQRTRNLEQLRQFEESLIGFVSGCKALPSYAKPKKQFNEEDLPDAICEEMLSLLQQKIPDAPFVISGVKGRLVSLKRTDPSYCELCDKVHSRMTPFLLVTNKGVELHCSLAAKGKKIELGQLSQEFVQRTIQYSYIDEMLDNGTFDVDLYEKKLHSFGLVPEEGGSRPERKKESEPLPFVEKKKESAPFACLGETVAVTTSLPTSKRKKITLVPSQKSEFRSDRELMLALSQRCRT